MKLAISNIAWRPDEDAEVTALMHEYSVTGIEIAPTKIWQDPTSVSDSDIKSYAARLTKKGIEIISMQALLFGHPELTIFDSGVQRKKTFGYLQKIIRLGGLLGAGPLVFGSPKNRLIRNMDKAIAMEIACEFFTSVGKCAINHDCIFCIEPNPEAYGCDFITTSGQAREIVNLVNHPGFGLHLDAAAMTMSNEDIVNQLPLAIPMLRHFHISEPHLEIVGTGKVDHKLFAELFSNSEYGNWHSIEMRQQEHGNNVENIAEALCFVHRTYDN